MSIRCHDHKLGHDILCHDSFEKLLSLALCDGPDQGFFTCTNYLTRLKQIELNIFKVKTNCNHRYSVTVRSRCVNASEKFLQYFQVNDNKMYRKRLNTKKSLVFTYPRVDQPSAFKAHCI